jgi:hypothetical protein
MDGDRVTAGPGRSDCGQRSGLRPAPSLAECRPGNGRVRFGASAVQLYRRRLRWDSHRPTRRADPPAPRHRDRAAPEGSRSATEGSGQLMARRSYGTGSLFAHRGRWYGKWRAGERQIKRVIGPKRQPGSRDGLTRKQAEAELRRLMQSTRPAPHRCRHLRGCGDGVPAPRRRGPTDRPQDACRLPRRRRGLPA